MGANLPKVDVGDLETASYAIAGVFLFHLACMGCFCALPPNSCGPMPIGYLFIVLFVLTGVLIVGILLKISIILMLWVTVMLIFFVGLILVMCFSVFFFSYILDPEGIGVALLMVLWSGMFISFVLIINTYQLQLSGAGDRNEKSKPQRLKQDDKISTNRWAGFGGYYNPVYRVSDYVVQRGFEKRSLYDINADLNKDDHIGPKGGSAKLTNGVRKFKIVGCDSNWRARWHQ